MGRLIFEGVLKPILSKPLDCQSTVPIKVILIKATL